MSEELGKILTTTQVAEKTDTDNLQSQIDLITPANQLLTGGVSYSGAGLVYDVSALTYRIQNVGYSAIASQVTLAAADPTNPRIDNIRYRTRRGNNTFDYCREYIPRKCRYSY
jgi:hypothetical protein